MPSKTDPLRRALLSWYRRERRELPWRSRVSPYRTWVSEIMLQQTTVAAALPYYERFLRRFPDLRALARASESEVLRYWAGLGYYSRARNLRAAARRVVSEHRGVFPSDFGSVLALPGVGRYTAGAILSIAFGKPYPVVDGNVIRVFSRLFGLKGRAKDPSFAKEIWARAEALLHRRSPGDWNQALMELGATVCMPAAPSCGACPVSRHCEAFRLGRQDELPLPEVRRQPVAVRWTCLRIERDGRLLLWKRSEKERLLKNLWAFPEAGRVPAEPGRRLGAVNHSITHHAVTVELREGAIEDGSLLPPEASWVPAARVRDYLVSSLWLKCLAAAGTPSKN